MIQLEPRYVVLKLKDVYALPEEDVIRLQEIVNRVVAIRKARGADPETTCLVVESDWPEFEPTAEAILRRSNKPEQLELPLEDTEDYCDAYCICPRCGCGPESVNPEFRHLYWTDEELAKHDMPPAPNRPSCGSQS